MKQVRPVSVSACRLEPSPLELARCISLADELLHECRLCARNCGADRSAGPAGACHAGPHASVFRMATDWAGETDLCPTFVVNLSGCNWRCAFCITGAASQNAAAGEPLDYPKLVQRLHAAVAAGARTFTLEGGEAAIHLPDALRIVALAREHAPTLPIVWKSNGGMAPPAMELLTDTVDVVLLDAKFGNDTCAWHLAAAQNHMATLRANLSWARNESGARVIVRHLVMPGHFACCTEPILRLLAAGHAGTELSLMNGFVPTWRSHRHEELKGDHQTEWIAACELTTQLDLRLAPWNLQPPTTATNPQEDAESARAVSWQDSAQDSAEDTRADQPASLTPAALHGRLVIGSDGTIRAPFTTGPVARALARLRDEFHIQHPDA